MGLAEATTELQWRPDRARREGTWSQMVQWVEGRWRVEEVWRTGRQHTGCGHSGGGESVGEGGSGGGGDTYEAEVDSLEDEERRRGVWEVEAMAVEYTEARRGYTLAAAWDEGAMIQAMARMDNPTLRWRYGDVSEEARDRTGESTERGDG